MTHQQSLSPRAWSELILLALFWGGSFMAFRVANDEIGVFTAVLHRVGWGAVLVWAYAILRGFAIPRDLRVWAAFLVMGLLNNVIPFSLIAWGQLTVETGLASIYNASTAIFGVLIAAIVFSDERLTSRKFIGIVVGLFGVIWAIGIENLGTFDIRSLAQLAIIVASVSYAIASAFARTRLSDLPPPVAAAGMLTGATLILLPLAYWIDGPVSLALDVSTIWAIVYLAVFASFAAYVLYYRVLAMAGAGNLMLVTLLIPPVAIVVGALMRDETLPAQAYTGFAILAAGLLILDGRILRLVGMAKA